MSRKTKGKPYPTGGGLHFESDGPYPTLMPKFIQELKTNFDGSNIDTLAKVCNGSSKEPWMRKMYKDGAFGALKFALSKLATNKKWKKQAAFALAELASEAQNGRDMISNNEHLEFFEMIKDADLEMRYMGIKGVVEIMLRVQILLPGIHEVLGSAFETIVDRKIEIESIYVEFTAKPKPIHTFTVSDQLYGSSMRLLEVFYMASDMESLVPYLGVDPSKPNVIKLLEACKRTGQSGQLVTRQIENLKSYLNHWIHHQDDNCDDSGGHGHNHSHGGGGGNHSHSHGGGSSHGSHSHSHGGGNDHGHSHGSSPTPAPIVPLGPFTQQELQQKSIRDLTEIMKHLNLDRNGLFEKSEYVNAILQTQPETKKTQEQEQKDDEKAKESTKSTQSTPSTATTTTTTTTTDESTQSHKPSTSSELECNVCQSTENLKLCSRCKKVCYCSAACQKKDWSLHKPDCKSN